MNMIGRNLSLTMILIVAILVATCFGFGAPNKKVAVLFFDDHSGFDSPTGCCLLPFIPFPKIFGVSRQRERWDLSGGFRDMMTRKLAESGVYDVVDPALIDQTIFELGVNRKQIRKNREVRSRIAEKLDADVLIIGDVVKFGQERLSGIISGTGAVSQSVVAGMGIRAYYYMASVATELKIFDRTGDEVAEVKSGKKASHQIGSIGAGPIVTVISDMELEARWGKQTISNKITKERPIVRWEELDRIRFGSDQYWRTLLGIATDSVLTDSLYRIREEIGPQPPKPESTEGVITGKVVHVSEDGKVFLNVGSDLNVAVGMRFEVISNIAMTDPDTGEVLGTTKEKVATVEVRKIESGKLSIAEIIEGDKVSRGDEIRQLPK